MLNFDNEEINKVRKSDDLFCVKYNSVSSHLLPYLIIKNEAILLRSKIFYFITCFLYVTHITIN